MKRDQLLVLVSVIEFLSAFMMPVAALVLGRSSNWVWEIFPVFLSASIVTFGLREMKRRT